MFKSFAKTIAVIVSSTILATLSVNAIDMSGYFSRTMLGALLFSAVHGTEEESVCPVGMVLVTQALVPFCVDAYEVSPHDACLYKNPQSENESTLNLIDPACSPVSQPGLMPWRYVSRTQAEQLCARAGKRLPTAGEWFRSAWGTPDQYDYWNEESCNVVHNRADGVSKTGSGMRCVSDAGAYDMIGNVWEWVNESVEYGVWDGRNLPDTGFVTSVDVYGVAFTTESVQGDIYSNDRFWLDSGITAGMMRGGYYNSQSYGGLYAIYAASDDMFVGDAVGFRCVADVKKI